MLKYKYKNICVIFLITVFLFKTSNLVDNGFSFGKRQFVNIKSQSCMIKADNNSGSIEVFQQNKRLWTGALSFIQLPGVLVKLVFQLLIIIISGFIFIKDIRRYILRLIAIYFHGSKYKDGDLLSTF